MVVSLLLLLATPASAVVSQSLWSNRRDAALAVVNNPLIVQLGSGELPAGSYLRLMEDRAVVLDGVQAACAAACRRGRLPPSGRPATSAAAAAAGLDILLKAEQKRRADDHEAWAAAMAAAGKSIEVDHEAWAAAQAAAGEPATQLACYTCGGPHLNVDCPEELAPSAAARALAAHLRSSPPAVALPAAAAVLRCVGWCHATLRAAGLGGGAAFGGWVNAHATRWAALADAADALLDASSSGDVADADADAEHALALSLLYSWISSEAGTAGLKGDGAPLQAAREAIDRVEPGYLQSVDRDAQFVRDVVLGTEPPRSSSSEPADDSPLAKALAYKAAQAKAAEGPAADSPLAKALAYKAAQAKASRSAPPRLSAAGELATGDRVVVVEDVVVRGVNVRGASGVVTATLEEDRDISEEWGCCQQVEVDATVTVQLGEEAPTGEMSYMFEPRELRRVAET